MDLRKTQKLEIKGDPYILKKVKKILPNYNLDFLGSGGLSHVFLTEHLGKKAIAKINKFSHEMMPFEIEKVDLKKIKHRNLMEVYEVLPSGVRISEYCGELDLETRTKYKNKLLLEQNLIAFWDVINAVEYLISLKLAHSDLNDTNIFFHAHKNNPKIIDYDTMRNLENRVILDNYFLTMGFTAPEAFISEQTDRTDIFSLGSVLYRILQMEDPIDPAATKVFKGDSKKDCKKYKELLKEKPEYNKAPLIKNKIMKELINLMREPESSDRIDIFEVKNQYRSAMPKYIRRKLAS